MFDFCFWNMIVIRGGILYNVSDLQAVILAAGEGKRMYSKKPKVLHKLCGITMVEHVCNAAKEAGVNELVVVVGHGGDEVQKNLQGVEFAYQENQLGTGHAVIQAEDYIKAETVFLLCGDTPLLKAETLRDMYEFHKSKNNHATVLTAVFENPYNYGRIIRNTGGDIIDIVEERDADSKQKEILEINSGIYLFEGNLLKKFLRQLNNDNDQGEYYLTDVIKIFNENNLKTGAFLIKDSNEIMGVNNRLQLYQAESLMRKKINEEHMLKGVTIVDPLNTYIDYMVKIDRDVTILPGCTIKGNTYIEEDAEIGPYSQIIDSHIGKGVSIRNSLVIESRIGEGTCIGPFAYLRPGNVVGKNAKIGDFVEMKNSNFGDNSKASHLTYIGDGDVGKNVNIGCGVVFVNYDGKEKHRTVVEDHSFIGCNTNLIAPVKVGKNSYIAAGTTITKDVPEANLAVGRAKQENKEGWVKRKGLLK